MDTSLAYSTQAAKSKNGLTLISDLVRYFSNHTDVQLIIVWQASNEFPILLKFEDNWVVHDYLRIYLKNSAQKAKKDQQNKDRELAAAAKGKRRGVYTPQSSRVMMLRACSISRLTRLLNSSHFTMHVTSPLNIRCQAISQTDSHM